MGGARNTLQNMRNSQGYISLVGESKAKLRHGRSWHSREDDSVRLVHDQTTGFCEHVNGPLHSLKGVGFLEDLRNY